MEFWCVVVAGLCFTGSVLCDHQQAIHCYSEIAGIGDKQYPSGAELVFNNVVTESVYQATCGPSKTYKNPRTEATYVYTNIDVLVAHPTYCYIGVYYGSKEAIRCLVSAYNFPYGHYTSGSCTGADQLAANEIITVKVLNTQGNNSCVINGNGYTRMLSFEMSELVD